MPYLRVRVPDLGYHDLWPDLRRMGEEFIPRWVADRDLQQRQRRIGAGALNTIIRGRLSTGGFIYCSQMKPSSSWRAHMRARIKSRTSGSAGNVARRSRRSSGLTTPARSAAWR